MNWVQKVFMWIGIVAIAVMALFPPWILKVNYIDGDAETIAPKDWAQKARLKTTQYSPVIFKRPDGEAITGRVLFYSIDFQRLFLQIGLVVLIVGGLIVTVGKKGEARRVSEKER